MTPTLLSIVVPVYDGERYIEAALDSLLVQIADGVEVLVIDDGSTDGTGELVKSTFARDIARGVLKLFVQTNQGVSAARNLGIAHATGAYIGFVDADDMVLPGYVHTILSALDTGADIVEFGYTTFDHAPDERPGAPHQFTNRRFGLHAAAAVLDGVHAIARWYPWSRVARAALFEGLAFPRGVRVCEDVMTVPLLYERAASVLALAAPLYGYRNNRASATFTIRPDYVPNLETFYQTIPRVGLRRHDYLRLAIAYSIHSCKRKSGSAMALPEEMARDMRRLRYVPAVYRAIELRKIGVLLYPSLFHFARRLARMVA